MEKIRPSHAAQQRWLLWGIVYGFTFLAILVLAYAGKLPTYLTNMDKPAHFGLYGLATYLGHRVATYRRMTVLNRRMPLFPLLFTLFTTIEEGCQALSPNRTFDGGDLIASFLGILIGYWLAERGNPDAHRSPDSHPDRH